MLKFYNYIYLYFKWRGFRSFILSRARYLGKQYNIEIGLNYLSKFPTTFDEFISDIVKGGANARV